jgi:hypothetical protein
MQIFKPKPTPQTPFIDILRGFQEAINGAQDTLQAQQEHNIRNFFEADGKPKSQTVQIGDKKLNIPLMSVVPHSNLVMDDVEIKFKTKVGAIKTEKAPGSVLQSVSGEELASANLQLQMGGIAPDDKDVMEVTIRFKAKEMPEGVARILDQYNKQI